MIGAHGGGGGGWGGVLVWVCSGFARGHPPPKAEEGVFPLNPNVPSLSRRDTPYILPLRGR